MNQYQVDHVILKVMRHFQTNFFLFNYFVLIYVSSYWCSEDLLFNNSRNDCKTLLVIRIYSFYSKFVSFTATDALPREMFDFEFLNNNSGLCISFTQNVERVESYSFNILGTYFSINLSEIDSSSRMQVFEESYE